MPPVPWDHAFLPLFSTRRVCDFKLFRSFGGATDVTVTQYFPFLLRAYPHARQVVLEKCLLLPATVTPSHAQFRPIWKRFGWACAMFRLGLYARLGRGRLELAINNCSFCSATQSWTVLCLFNIVVSHGNVVFVLMCRCRCLRSRLSASFPVHVVPPVQSIPHPLPGLSASIPVHRVAFTIKFHYFRRSITSKPTHFLHLCSSKQGSLRTCRVHKNYVHPRVNTNQAGVH
jgi:hypothetical protein